MACLLDLEMNPGAVEANVAFFKEVHLTQKKRHILSLRPSKHQPDWLETLHVRVEAPKHCTEVLADRRFREK